MCIRDRTADNVQRDVTYMCNCCGCCCGRMQAIRGVGITNAIVSSNWVAETDFSNCRGCKKCFHRCPAEAITMVDNDGKGRRKYWSVVDPQKCLGCGVCTDVCRWEGRYMVPRPHRVFTADDTGPDHRDGGGARQARRPARRHPHRHRAPCDGAGAPDPRADTACGGGPRGRATALGVPAWAARRPARRDAGQRGAVRVNLTPTAQIAPLVPGSPGRWPAW